MVDDRKKNLENIKRALGNSIKFVGLRYNATDAKVHAFNPNIAEVQMRFFKKILTDEAAKAIVNTEKLRPAVKHKQI